MSEVLDRLREQYPAYKDVSDGVLAEKVGDLYPTYLEQDPDLKGIYTEAKASRERFKSQPTIVTADDNLLRAARDYQMTLQAEPQIKKQFPPRQLQPGEVVSEGQVYQMPQFEPEGPAPASPFQRINRGGQVYYTEPSEEEWTKLRREEQFGYGPDDPIIPLGDWLIKERGQAKTQMEEGLNESLRNSFNGLVTPRNVSYMLASAGVANTGRMAARLVAALWTGIMGKETAQEMPAWAEELGAEMGKPEDQRDPRKIGQILGESGVSTLFTLLPASHMIGEPAAVELANRLGKEVEGLGEQPGRLEKQIIEARAAAGGPSLEQFQEMAREELPGVTLEDLQARREMPQKPPVEPKPPISRVAGSKFRPSVPETPAEAEREMHVIEEIRAKGARTIRQIQELFPERQLSREEARTFRNQAWGGPPEEGVPSAIDERIQPESGEPEHTGAAPGENLPADQTQIRKEQGGQASGGNRPGGEPTSILNAPEPNEFGVYPDEAAETLQYQGKKAKAQIRLLQLPQGWISAARYEHRSGSHAGRASPLTAQDTFRTRAEALRSAAQGVIEGQEAVLADKGGVVTETQRGEARKMLAWAQGLTGGQGEGNRPGGIAPEVLRGLGLKFEGDWPAGAWGFSPIDQSYGTFYVPEGATLEQIQQAAQRKKAAFSGAKAWEASTPVEGVKVGGQYEVVEADQARTSFDPDYDQSLQPRDRSRQASREQIARMVQNFEPQRMGEAPTTDMGAPMLDERGQVISGNGRTAAVRGIYNTGRAEPYRSWLLNNAEAFGLNPEKISTMAKPMLVRRVTDYGGLDKTELARQSNQQQVAGLSDAEKAASDARMLSNNPRLLESFRPGEEGNVLAASNRDFLNAFIQGTGDQASLLTKEGYNGPALVRRVKNALLATFLGSENQRLLRQLIESGDELNVRNAVNGTLESVPSLMRFKGTTYDLSGILHQALTDLVRLRESGEKLEDFLGTRQLWADPARTVDSDRVLRHLFNARSARAVSEPLRQYAKLAQEALRDQESGGMFGQPPASRTGIIERVYGGPEGPTQTDLPPGSPPRGGPAGPESGAPPQPPAAPGPAPASGPAKGFGAENKLVTPERAAELRKRLLGKLGGRVSMGLDPSIFSDAVQLGAFYIEGGLREFESWAAQMVKDLGEKIRPYLRSIYDTARTTIGEPAGGAGIQPGSGKPDLGRPDSGSAGRRSIRPPEERIITARPEETKQAFAQFTPGAVAKVAANPVPRLSEFLDNHQRQGAFMSISGMERVGGFLLADGTGVGKTRQALTVAEYYRIGGQPVLIVTKAETIKPDWKKNTFAGSYAADAGTMGVKVALAREGIVKPGEIGITTYENLGSVAENITPRTVLILDESHALKNIGSNRSQQGMQAIDRANKVMFMTATPADKPLHIHYLARMGILEGQTLPAALTQLGLRQVEVNRGGKKIQVWTVDNKMSQEERLRRFRNKFARLTAKGQMLKREISMEGNQVRVLEVAMPPEAHGLMDEIVGFFGYKNIDQAQGLEKARILMHQRRQQEPFKVAPAVMLTQKELAEGRQVVLFISRVNESEVGRWVKLPGMRGGEGERVRKVLMSSEGTAKTLMQALNEAGIKDVVEIHGEAEELATAAMDKFQKGDARVLVATTESGGTGINLDDTRGTHPRSMIVVTAPFSAVDNVQAAGRIWRLKTQSAARFFYLFGDTPVDQWNASIIGSKMKQLGATVEGQVKKLDVSDPDLVDVAEFGKHLKGEAMRAGELREENLPPPSGQGPSGKAPPGSNVSEISGEKPLFETPATAGRLDALAQRVHGKPYAELEEWQQQAIRQAVERGALFRREQPGEPAGREPTGAGGQTEQGASPAGAAGAVSRTSALPEEEALEYQESIRRMPEEQLAAEIRMLEHELLNATESGPNIFEKVLTPFQQLQREAGRADLAERMRGMLEIARAELYQRQNPPPPGQGQPAKAAPKPAAKEIYYAQRPNGQLLLMEGGKPYEPKPPASEAKGPEAPPPSREQRQRLRTERTLRTREQEQNGTDQAAQQLARNAQPKRWFKGLRRVFAPQTLDEGASIMAGVLRFALGRDYQNMRQADFSLGAWRNEFDRTPVPRDWIYRPGEPLPRNYEVMRAADTGQVEFLTPNERAFIEVMRQLFDEAIERVHEVSPNSLRELIENYFPRIWRDPEKNRELINRLLARRPWEGPKSFLKKRVLEYFTDGLELGLRPISDNPVDVVLQKLGEMYRFVATRRAMEEAKALGLRRFVYIYEKAPADWVEVDDPSSKVHKPPMVPIKEAFDAQIRAKTIELLEQLGVPHERLARIGGRRWGYAEQDTGKIVTKFGGGDFIIWHEFGHQMDWRYPELRRLLGATSPNSALGKELAALADLRYEGEPAGPGYRRYVRKAEEKLANVFDAYLRAPDKFKATAPKVWDAFKEFLSQHPELQVPLDEIRPSLRLGVGKAEMHVGGPILLGRWMMPPGAAQVVTNYLQPGLGKFKLFRGLRDISGLMNSTQLLGFFHGQFVLNDSFYSGLGLSLYDVMKGKPTRAAKELGMTLTGAGLVQSFVRGHQIKAAIENPTTANAFYRQMADLAVMQNLRAGHGNYDPEFIRRWTRALREMKSAPSTGAAWESLWRTIPAGLEAAMWPVMRLLVPRMKLGIFSKMAERVLADNPDADMLTMRRLIAQAADATEDRLGQVTYDNLFQNRTLKDAGQLAFRAYGWQLTKYRMIGGGLGDWVRAANDMAHGRKPDVTFRMTYLPAMVMGHAILGGILTYVLTQKRPQKLTDYLFPETGLIDAYGRPVRVAIADFVKDIVADWKAFPSINKMGAEWSRKLAPLWNIAAEMYRNQDFWGTEIFSHRMPGEPAMEHLLQNMREGAEYFASTATLPFSVRAGQRFKDVGGGKLAQVGPWFGLVPAPRYALQTAAEERAAEITRGSEVLTKEQSTHAQAIGQLVRDVRTGKINNEGQFVAAARTAGVRNEAELTRIKQRILWTPLQYQVQKMTVDHAMQVFDLGTSAEKVSLALFLAQKIQNAYEGGNLDEEKTKRYVRLVTPYYQQALSRRQPAAR